MYSIDSKRWIVPTEKMLVNFYLAQKLAIISNYLAFWNVWNINSCLFKILGQHQGHISFSSQEIPLCYLKKGWVTVLQE